MTDMLKEYRARMMEMGDAIIGQILWFSITEAKVSFDDLAIWFVELDLDSAFLPDRIRPIHAFRKATSNAKCEYAYSNGHTAHLSLVEVSSDADTVTRHLVRMVKNSAGKQLTFDPKIGEAIFYRQGRSQASAAVGSAKVKMGLTPSLSDFERERAEAMLLECRNDYEDACKYLDSQAIRAVIRNYVISLNAISTRPGGGVYFVHRSRSETVEKLERLVAKIGGRSVFHTLPLLDDEKQRHMLINSFESELVSEAAEIAKKIKEVRSKKKINADEVNKLQLQYRNAIDRSYEYSEALGLAQEKAANMLEDVVHGLTSLIDDLAAQGATR